MKTAVKLESLSKSFDKVNALKNISLNFEENKIYGLLGKNGAGKTTLLKIISTQLFPTRGELKIYNQSPNNNDEILQNICLIREKSFYPEELKVKELLDIAGGFYPCWDRGFASRLVVEFGLDTNKRFKNLSKGQQSSVGIIIGLASRAPITIYDEAYLGLDASARQLFYDRLIEDYSEHPRTIIFSSHLIDECSNLFEKVIIIDKGTIILNEDIDSLREKSFIVAGRKDKIEKYLESKKVLKRDEMGRLITAAVFNKITSKEQSNMEQDDIEVQPLSLQKLFIYLTTKNGGIDNEQTTASL